MSEHLPGLDPDWLEWARALQALSQTGLTFAESPFDVQRYRAVQEIAAKLMAGGSNRPSDQVLREFQGEAGYATPKLGVRGAVFRDGEVLMVREVFDGLWSLPGGWIDVGDLPSQSIEREVREESGFEARARKLLGVYDRRKWGHPSFPHHVYILVFECELTGGAARTSVETSEVKFFGKDRLPPLSNPRSPPELLERIFAHRDHPEWPTDFD